MKKLIIITVLFTSSVFAQQGISFALLHDVKLGLGLDKEHKNDKYTTDLIFNMNWETRQYEYYYFTLQSQYEHANLYSGYLRRYSVHGIWNFNKLIVPKLNIGIGIGVGALHRENYGGMLNYSGTMDISYPMFKNVAIIAKNEWVKRPELPNKKIGYNLSFGIKYKPINL